MTLLLFAADQALGPVAFALDGGALRVNPRNGWSGFEIETDEIITINGGDWWLLRDNHLSDMSGLSLDETYPPGDLNGDRDNDERDFGWFKTAFDEADGLGAFDTMLAGFPEPSTMLLVAAASATFLFWRLIRAGPDRPWASGRSFRLETVCEARFVNRFVKAVGDARWCALAAALAASAWFSLTNVAIAGEATIQLKVMTFNIRVGGTDLGQPLSKTIDVIQLGGADIVGMQEDNGNAADVAAALDYDLHVWNYNGRRQAILSRFPIISTSAHGAEIQISEERTVFMFTTHLLPSPYGPYDILNGVSTTEAEVIASQQGHVSQMAPVLSDMEAARIAGMPVFLTGDFNEPSHLDWTQEAADAGLHSGWIANWPTSNAIMDAGYTDSYREVHPDEVGTPMMVDPAHPGFGMTTVGDTWRPESSIHQGVIDRGWEVMDRIDMVYYTGLGVEAVASSVIGSNAQFSDIAFADFPSDHRAVVTTFELPAVGPVIGDLNFDGVLDEGDWTIFRGYHLTDFSGLTLTEAYARGDLDSDLDNDELDFAAFKGAYKDANGAGAFDAMLTGVPEPSTLLLVAAASATFLFWRLSWARSPLGQEGGRFV